MKNVSIFTARQEQALPPNRLVLLPRQMRFLLNAFFLHLDVQLSAILLETQQAVRM